jgi:hypothetical protein
MFKEISDLGLVAWLMTKGYEPRDKRMVGKKVLFMFDDQPEIDEISNEYFSGDMSKFSNNIRRVKSIIYQMKEE